MLMASKLVHHAWVEILRLPIILALIVLVDPPTPVNLNLRILQFFLSKSGPVLSFFISLLNIQNDVPALGVPFRLIQFDPIKQFQGKPIILSPSFS